MIPAHQQPLNESLRQNTVVESERDHTGDEEDFIEVTYRALSATVLADRAIDFSNTKMLKRAVRLLKGQTVFKDHETSVNNWVGRVLDSVWDEETKGIPPGINAVLKLDAVKDPMAVRGVSQGIIHSASVTVSFEWKPSHAALMDNGTFFERLGEDVDGDVVRIIVTHIEKFLELSLVWQGADAFAKKLGMHHDLEDHVPIELPDAVGPATLLSVQSFSKEDPMDQLKSLIEKAFQTTVTTQNFTQVLQSYVDDKVSTVTNRADTELSKLAEQLNQASAKVISLESTIKELEPQAKLGAQYLADERKEAIRLCKLVKGENINEAILKTLENGELEVVQAWKAEFAKEAEGKFPAACARCGSTEVKRKSSQTPAESSDAQTQPSPLSKKSSEYVRDLHGV